MKYKFSQVARDRRTIGGFVDSITAAGRIMAFSFPKPSLPQTSVASDWTAVGKDIQAAIAAYGEKTDK